MVTAEVVSMCGHRGKLQEVQRVCEDGGKTVLTAIVEVVELACECAEAKRKKAMLSKRKRDMGAKLVEACAVGSTMRKRLVERERRTTTLKTLLDDAQLALEKLASEAASRQLAEDGESLQQVQSKLATVTTS